MAGYADVKKYAKQSDCTEFEAVVELCKAGEDVRIQGFGTFKKQHKDARYARNPRTGETVKVAAKDVLHFKAASGLSLTTAPARRTR